MKRVAYILICLGIDAAASAGTEASVEDVIRSAERADVVIIGEIHDNPHHHRIQAEIVAALRPAALVFEMVQQSDEARINAMRADGWDRSAVAEALDWDASGWPDFDQYAPIFEAAPEAVVFGAGQPRDDVRRAVEEGAAAVFGPDAVKYRLDEALEQGEQAALEAVMMASHCDALPVSLLPGMVEAQRFRDASLADAALWARTLSGTEGQVVVITGNGHADRLRGVPALIAIAEPDVDVLTIGQFEVTLWRPEAFDYWLVAPEADRDDPCASMATPDQ